MKNLVSIGNTAAFERVRDGIITNVRLAAHRDGARASCCEGKHDVMYVLVAKADRLALVARLDDLGLVCHWDPLDGSHARGRGRGGTLYIG